MKVRLVFEIDEDERLAMGTSLSGWHRVKKATHAELKKWALQVIEGQIHETHSMFAEDATSELDG